MADSCAELRALERLLFAGDPCSAAGLLLAQIRLLFARAQAGVVIRRGDLLSVLQAASRVSSRSTTELPRFLGDQPEGVRHA